MNKAKQHTIVWPCSFVNRETEVQVVLAPSA